MNLPRLEELRMELESFLMAKEMKEKEIFDIEIDMADIQEDIRMEIERNYHL